MKRLSYLVLFFLVVSPSLKCEGSVKQENRRVWYFTNFYSNYVSQDLEKISAASKNHGIEFVNDHLRLYKYLPQFRADYGNSARLSDDGYNGVIVVIPEQHDIEDLSLLRGFVEAGGNVVVVFNAISAHYTSNVEAFKKTFNIRFKGKQIVVRSDSSGVAFDGEQLCRLWKRLKVGSKSWEKAGVDAYIITEGEGWQDEVYLTGDDGENYCVSASRKLGKGQLFFQVAPNDCVNDNRGPGRLHETHEFFFPKHISDFNNLEAFMRLVEFASVSTITPTKPDPVPSHEAHALDKVELHNGEAVMGKIMRQDKEKLWIKVSGELLPIDKNDVRSFEIDRSSWPCFVTGEVVLEEYGPASDQLVDIYQDRASYDYSGSSHSKENRHIVKTDSNGKFMVALNVPGTYEIMISTKKKQYHYYTKTFEAVLGESRKLEIIVRKNRQAQVKWCYSPGESRSFTKSSVVTGETVISTDNLNRVKFTERGLEQVQGSSDFIVLQKDDTLYVRNFDVCDTGHGIIELGKVDYDSVLEAPRDNEFTRQPEPILELGKVILIKAYDGKGYAKMLVESVDISSYQP